MKINRKQFLRTTGVLTGGVLLSPILANFYGCSASAESTSEKVSVVNNEIKYKVTDRLKNPGDAVTLEIENTGGKIILLKGDNGYIALNPTCTHKGCGLIKRKTFFECPCHGSEFDLKGNVLKGPAEIPLQNFKTELSHNTVTIFLK